MVQERNESRRNMLSVGVSVGCLVVALGYVELRRVGPAPPAAALAGGDSARTSGAGGRIAALEREVQRLRAASRGSSRDELSPPAASPAAPRDVALDLEDDSPPAAEEMTPAEREQAREEQIARDEAARRQFLGELDQRVDTEPVDPKWRAATREQIEVDFSRQLDADVSIAEATCASTVCRVRLEHPALPRLQSNTLVELALQRSEPLGALELHYDAQSREGVTTVYMVRAPDTLGSPDDG